MLPIRFIAESFNFNVEWEQSTRTITVIKAETAQTVSTPSPVYENGKILVAYFSVPETDGVDAVSSASRVVEDGEVVGNVEFIAETIADETNADVFRIETVQEYPGTHQELLEFAAAEGESNARPALSTSIDNLDEYDTIFIGYPIWNADLPMPMYTFFDTYEFDGKTIIPFTAHGGSGFAGTISTIKELKPDADVEQDGFAVSRNGVSASKADIISWVAGLGLTAAAYTGTSDTDTSGIILVAYFSHEKSTLLFTKSQQII